MFGSPYHAEFYIAWLHNFFDSDRVSSTIHDFNLKSTESIAKSRVKLYYSFLVTDQSQYLDGEKEMFYRVFWRL